MMNDRIFTVPNLISVLRLLCIPLFVWVLFGAENRSAAAILLAVLGATDWVDGWIARKNNLETEIVPNNHVETECAMGKNICC